ncbi:MAG TPA: DUF1611 domain-containing protein, partial [Alphaproteobacteria bacterium]|nr:DUF1611 domain-containing protein [Alphaproteobacteria bacterium]
QPDLLVMCHEPGRPHMRGLPHFPLPDLQDCIEANLRAARLTNPDARLLGFSLNTVRLAPDAARRALRDIEERFGLPAVDPLRTGVAPLVDAMG